MPIPTPNLGLIKAEGTDLFSRATYNKNLDLMDAKVAAIARFGAPVYNIKGFDAVGDGLADDTASIQSALDAAERAGGGLVYIPSGTYKISSALVIASNVTLEGEGFQSHIILNEPAKHIGIHNKNTTQGDHNIQIRNLRLNGNGGDLIGANDGIAFYSVSDFSITGCLIERFDGYNIVLWHKNGIDIPCQRGLVTNNISRNSSEMGIELYSAVDTTVIGNICEANGYHGIYAWNGSNRVTISGNLCQNNGKNGIHISGADAQTIGKTKGITITGNICHNNLIGGIQIENSSELELSDFVITGNCILSDHNNTVTGVNTCGISAFLVNNLVVADNNISGYTYGIYIQGEPEGRQVSITGNIVTGAGYAGIRLYRTSGSVHTNIVSHNDSYGIVLTDVADTTVEGNTVYNNGRTGIYAHMLKLGCSNNTVSGNRCFDARPDVNAKTQRMGIVFEGKTNHHNMVMGNNCRGNVESISIRVSGTGNILTLNMTD